MFVRKQSLLTIMTLEDVLKMAAAMLLHSDRVISCASAAADMKNFRPGEIRIINNNLKMVSSHLHSDTKRGQYVGVSSSPVRRIVFKNGQINTVSSNVDHHHLRLLQSLFATLVDMQWRWIILIFASSFFLSWLAFALLWWFIAYVHGDLETGHLPGEQEAANWTPCVTGILGFTSSFLFSMETQHTIGYGSRAPTEECPEGVILVCMQSVIGLTLQTAVVGVVLAKLARAKQRTNTILFSHNAVICRRENGLCLMLRIGDLQKSRIIEAKLTLQFIVINATDDDDEVLSPFRSELKTNANKPHFYFMWPEMLIHNIDKDSPLFDLSSEELLQARFEIVVILEGTLESTNQRVQARTSFLPEEILWGRRFQPMFSYNEGLNAYELDYNMFDCVRRVADTPQCSARDLLGLLEEQPSSQHDVTVDIDSENSSSD